MAGPIKISVLADASAATKSVQDFGSQVDTSISGAARSMQDGSDRIRQSANDAGDGFDRLGEGADGAEGKAQGFADTLTGVQDVMAGTSQIASGDLYGGLLTLGTGFADLAGGAAAFLIPTLQKATGAMKALNFTFLTNPVFLIVAAIVALVAVIVIAYKKSDKFRKIVDTVWAAIKKAVSVAINFITTKIPKVWDKAKEIFGKVKDYIGKKVTEVKEFFTSLPGRITKAFRDANTLLFNKGKDIIFGLWDGIKSLGSWLFNKVTSFVTDNIPGPIARALGIASPSKVMKKYGKYTAEGLALGITASRDKVRRASTGLAAAAAQPVAAGALSAGTNGGGGQATVVLEVDTRGSSMDELFGEMIRKYVRVRGGNVQAVLGRG